MKEKYILSLCLSEPNKEDWWSIVSMRYSYTSVRRALQAKSDYLKYWQRCCSCNGINPKVRIEHIYI